MKKLQFNYTPTPINIGTLRKRMSHFKHIKFSKACITALECISFNGGQIVASDLDTTILLKCSFFTGDGCIPNKVILDTIKSCAKDDMIFIVFKDLKAEIYINDVLFISVDTVSATHYPQVICPHLFDNQFYITSTNFDFTPLATCLGKDELRKAMMHFKFGKGQVVTTNAHVMKWRDIDFKGDDILLPSLYGKLSGHFDIYLSQYDIEEFGAKGNYLICDYNNECVIITRIAQTQYPDYKAVIPTDNPSTIVVETSILKDAIKKVSICASHINQVIFTISDLKLNLTCFDDDKGTSASVDIPLHSNIFNRDMFSKSHKDVVEQTLQMAFDYKYILSNLEDRKTTEISYSTTGRATIWNKQMLIMPIQMVETKNLVTNESKEESQSSSNLDDHAELSEG